MPGFVSSKAVDQEGVGRCHGLRTPKEAFFHRNPKLLGFGRQFGQSPFNQPLFLQKTKPLYPNIYLGFEFEFGPQTIRNLAIVCP